MGERGCNSITQPTTIDGRGLNQLILLKNGRPYVVKSIVFLYIRMSFLEFICGCRGCRGCHGSGGMKSTRAVGQDDASFTNSLIVCYASLQLFMRRFANGKQTETVFVSQI